MKTSNKFPVILAAVLVLLSMFFFLIPQGSRVEAVVLIENDTIQISECYLKKLYSISIIEPREAMSLGDRSITLKVFYDNSEITSSTRNNVGTGSCVISTTTLKNIKVNSELIIKVELLTPNNEIIAESITTLLYK